jgi:hypothetical protein
MKLICTTEAKDKPSNTLISYVSKNISVMTTKLTSSIPRDNHREEADITPVKAINTTNVKCTVNNTVTANNISSLKLEYNSIRTSDEGMIYNLPSIRRKKILGKLPTPISVLYVI